jgi:hypothetical protein
MDAKLPSADAADLSRRPNDCEMKVVPKSEREGRLCAWSFHQ